MKNNLLLIALVLLIVIVPLVMNPNHEFGGADGEAMALVESSSEGFEPWFNSIWTPPSGEIESLLFAVQAALGSGVLMYILGYLKGKKANA